MLCIDSVKCTVPLISYCTYKWKSTKVFMGSEEDWQICHSQFSSFTLINGWVPSNMNNDRWFHNCLYVPGWRGFWCLSPWWNQWKLELLSLTSLVFVSAVIPTNRTDTSIFMIFKYCEQNSASYKFAMSYARKRMLRAWSFIILWLFWSLVISN